MTIQDQLSDVFAVSMNTTISRNIVDFNKVVIKLQEVRKLRIIRM
jgi:hypothetical protein